MRLFWAALLIVVLVTLVRVPSSADDAPRGPLRVLFIGNSYTRFHQLPILVRRMLIERTGRQVTTRMRAQPGWTLARHLELASTREELAAAHPTHVVLQGHSRAALEAPGQLVASVRAFHALIRPMGATTVLYATWATERALHEGSTRDPDRIQAEYTALARELGARLAPAGEAFARAARAGLDPFGPDGAHPSIEGSYLAALTLAHAIGGVAPTDVRYRPHPITATQARSLQSLAAAALER